MDIVQGMGAGVKHGTLGRGHLAGVKDLGLGLHYPRR